MLSSTQTLAPKPTALPPAAPPAQANGANPAAGPSFAQFMTGQAGVPTPPTQNATPPDRPKSIDDAAPAQPATATPARRAAPSPAKPAGQARASDSTAKSDPKAGTQADAAGATDAKTASASAKDEDETPDSPELKEFTQLLSMATSAAPAAPVDTTAAMTDALRAASHGKAAAAADDDARTAAGGNRADAADGTQAPRAKAAELQADKPAARAASSELLKTAAADSQNNSAGAHAAPDAAPPSFAAVLAQALPSVPISGDNGPAATYASLQAPLHSQAFAPELGARVSLLAVDGVQQAELQLNPADMGPVAVQIVVDGNQAQVSFHAAQAETRQALEQSLPDLAAALQGQGLTLSGGGVFQQAPRDSGSGRETQASDGNGRGSRADAGGRVDGTASTTAGPVRRSVGLLDTFA
ncbi:MAG: flagellar hook-length control protein FliK [Burkholderiales bacterium]|nr:flagellar hook-length control protein FliK [Burkholderiales bacterium]